jgi:membrane-associated phospholipid phosphatase
MTHTAHPDSGWYAAVTRLAERFAWLNGPIVVFTTWGLLLLAVLLVLAWWTARRADAATMAAALVAPVATVLAYVVDDAVKLVVAEHRPCQVIAGVHPVLPCDPVNDFSFPSNHSALAAAMAVGVFLVNRALGVIGVVLALLEAASRVYVGAHYPHDVVVGLLVGGVVAAVICLPAEVKLAPHVERLRQRDGFLRPLLISPQPAPLRG